MLHSQGDNFQQTLENLRNDQKHPLFCLFIPALFFIPPLTFGSLVVRHSKGKFIDMYKRTQVFLFMISMLTAGSVQATGKEKNSVKAYPAPAGVLQNTDFTVKVRVPGQPWQDLPEYLVKVDRVKGTAHK
jgi:hypothetical protein